MTSLSNSVAGQVDFAIVVRGRHANVSERFRAYATEKMSRLNRFSIPMRHIDVEVSHEANPRQHDRAYEVELTCNGDGSLIRAEAHAADKYTALDLAHQRLQERLRRMHDKARAVQHKRMSERIRPELPMPSSEDHVLAQLEAEDVDVVLESGPLVVRTKHIESAVMTVEQAVEAMELVGHDFFMFTNVATGKCSVLYRRRGYDFGLVEMQEAS